MVTTNQNSTIDTHTKKKKEPKHNTKVSYQVTEEQKRDEQNQNKSSNRAYILMEDVGGNQV